MKRVCKFRLPYFLGFIANQTIVRFFCATFFYFLGCILLWGVAVGFLPREILVLSFYKKSLFQ